MSGTTRPGHFPVESYHQGLTKVWSGPQPPPHSETSLLPMSSTTFPMKAPYHFRLAWNRNFSDRKRGVLALQEIGRAARGLPLRLPLPNLTISPRPLVLSQSLQFSTACISRFYALSVRWSGCSQPRSSRPQYYARFLPSEIPYLAARTVGPDGMAVGKKMAAWYHQTHGESLLNLSCDKWYSHSHLGMRRESLPACCAWQATYSFFSWQQSKDGNYREDHFG